MRMHTFGRTAAASGTALVMALGSVSAASTATAAERPEHAAPTHYYVFTQRHQSFVYHDSVGTFRAQVRLTGPHSRRYPMPWMFQITSAKLRAIARGNAVCTATGLNGRYHDRHVIPVGYVWHSTVAPHRARKVYTLSGTCTFAVQVGGRPGRAFVGFSFHYAVNPSSRGAGPASSGPVVKTSVQIRH
ncbi:hypothetical protein [Actinomadura citrea]|jgi:hypothetical protein|uniref:Uncharacterized protein n=1 Tax=Actinomadura citrea TaxID=46158 RepID=A0A7Y9G8N2_9ACTN|nr:hypothetical protein [Actinomadura citrea]NYE12000.1 hypothetical protein [Actinomadura citrea]GGT48853.1 hypothetical protein GCM10010177_00510 [Actinomadura citrea]